VSLQLRSSHPKSNPDQMQKCQVARDIYIYLALRIPEGGLIPFLPDWSFYFRLHIIISRHILPSKPGRMLIRGELKKKLAVGINPASEEEHAKRSLDIGRIRGSSQAQTECAMSFRMIARRRNNSPGIPSSFRRVISGARVKRSRSSARESQPRGDNIQRRLQ